MLVECQGSIKLFGQVITLLSDSEHHAVSISKVINQAATAISTAESAETKEEENAGPAKPPKKPDKILACPRCESMDTKFCYFNNYNVNQPRYFCRNCQRYWTAGGTMRNVPVGAGRRKSKSSSQTKHITIQEIALDPPMPFVDDGNEGREQTRLDDALDTNPCNESQSANVCQMHACQSPFLNGYPWLCRWAPAAPVFGFYPVSGNRADAASSPPSADSSVAGRSSQLGKRNSDRADHAGNEEALKTMRIDDPDRIAKSSVWGTVGIKRDKAGGVSPGGMFSGLHAKEVEMGSGNSALAAILGANPAALARYCNFKESA